VSFAAASAVVPDGDGRWAGAIAPGWDIVGNANGGYLMSIAARASALASGRPDPVTLTGHFLRPGVAGPVAVETEILKEGKRFATVRATMYAKGKPILATLGSFSELGDTPEGPERVEAEPPRLPPIAECIPVEPTETFPPPFMGNVDLRLHPGDIPTPGRPADLPRLRGWFRWREGEALDTLGLVTAVDAFPPTILNADLPIAWTPTLELTAHIRSCPPAHEWLRCAFTTRFITGGFLEEDGELWDGAGRLVAQSRQLSLLPRG
jgi:acyl-CoA thioesterase